jgi:hypothetical protein
MKLQLINVRESLLSCPLLISGPCLGIAISRSAEKRQIAVPSGVLVPGRFSGRYCRRCGAEIATANLMDADPGIDRHHFSLVLQGGERHRLSPAEWQVFTALYQRHGRIVPLAELATATQNPKNKLSGIFHRLQRSLVRSRFCVLTHRAHGYELIVCTEQWTQRGNGRRNE